MNYPLFIARRLSLSSSGKRQAPAVAVAVAAVALSVAVMIASVCIVLGFKQEIRNKLVGFNGHISLYASPLNPDDDNIVTLIPSLRQSLDSLSFIKEYSLQVAAPAILKTDTDFKGVYLKALSGDMTSGFLVENLDEGELPDFSDSGSNNKVVISRTAANQLGLKTGDKINTYFITDDIRVRKLEITGIFNTHFDQYDNVLAFGSPTMVRKIGELDDNQGTYLQIITDDFDKIQDYTYQIQTHLNRALADGQLFRHYKTENVINQGIGYFSWLELLDTNVVVVLILMMIVSCITLISGMLIIIIEKKRFIGMMKSLGAPTSKVRLVFVYLAIRIAILGMIIGNVVMIALMYLQDHTHFLHLDPESYYIDFVPVEMYWPGILFLNFGVIVVTYLVLILPSRFVAGISPAETLRSE